MADADDQHLAVVDGDFFHFTVADVLERTDVDFHGLLRFGPPLCEGGDKRRVRHADDDIDVSSVILR
jgi:hypothetical protein